MPHSEKLLQRETLGKNRVFTHERWQVQLENGRTAEREIIRHPGGVGIVAVDENGRLLMVRQYRSGMGCEALEIPAGKRDPGETPEQCGRRELEEETGYRVENQGKLEYLMSLNTTVAFCDEAIDIFVARNLIPSHQHLDEDEYIEVEAWEVKDLMQLIYDGKMTDAKTVAAISTYAIKYGAMV